jgi:hypothetical protein
MPKLSFNDEFHVSHVLSSFWFKDRMESQSVMSPYAKAFGSEVTEVRA